MTTRGVAHIGQMPYPGPQIRPGRNPSGTR
jgi:hypothetical protein